MDYGKKDPSLGWRFTDAWMSMAGKGDKGEPNGLPVDEWGIRVDENSRPVGSCVARGGDDQRRRGGLCRHQVYRLAAEVHAARSPGHDLLRGRPGAGAGEIAQQMFWYTAFTADMVKPGIAGGERGRHAEVADGALAARRLLVARARSSATRTSARGR